MTDAAAVRSFQGLYGHVGAFLPEAPFAPTPATRQREEVRRLERSGFRIAWTNELIGKDTFAQLSMLLAACDGMAFGTCIANVWARSPQTARGAAALLAEAYPDRFVLGLGVGYPQQAAAVGREFGRPIATMRGYLAAMDEAAASDGWPVPPAYPCILGANGPQMLALARDLTDGALPAGSAPDQTAQARQLLGSDKLLVVYLDVSAQAGGLEQVVATVQQHLDAGADHVIAGAPLGSTFEAACARLRALAPALPL